MPLVAAAPWRHLFAVLLGAVAALVFYILFLTKAWGYLSDDPYACANCHLMDEAVSSWASSAHHNTALCNDCHAPRTPAVRQISQAVNGIRHGWSFTFGPGGDVRGLHDENSRILEENCRRCHAALLVTMAPRAAPAGEPGCTRCHRTAGHG